MLHNNEPDVLKAELGQCAFHREMHMNNPTTTQNSTVVWMNEDEWILFMDNTGCL